MTNFKKEEIGKISEVGKNYENGKAFLHDLLGLTSCEISVSAMPAGVKLPFNHKHKQNEEVYIFLKGEGSMTLDNEVVEFKEGTCIKFQKKISEGKSKKLARKHLARQVSNQIWKILFAA